MTSRTALPANPFRSPERALPAKTRLDEYEIELALAQSSFGVVYRAYDHALRLHVAIKEYLPDALALRSAETQVVLRARSHAERFDQGLQAFVGEAQTLARCDHPSLLRIVRVLQRHGTAYRVMRFTPGPTLLAHRRELAAPPELAALRSWFDSLLGALDALHEEGAVHGAVAPGNILLLHGGRPLLLDMDTVRSALISDRTQSMMAALEPCFEPPEQRAPSADTAMGPWSDLYSLAATLHFCLSGQLPAPPMGTARAFEPLGEVWQRLQAAQPALGEVPGWLTVLEACLAENPQARPQNVAQVRELLDAQPAARRAPAPRATPRQVVTLPEAMALPAAAAVAAPPVVAPAARAEVPRVESPRVELPPRAPPPAPPAPPIDPTHAKVIAELDQTFAFIAAQAHEEANAPPKAAAESAAAGPTEAAPDPAAETAAEAAAGPTPRQRLWLMGAAALLLLVAMGAAVVWMLKAYDPGLLGGRSVSAATQGNWSPAPANAATVAAPTAAPATPLVYPPPSAGRAENQAAAMAPAPPAAVEPEVPAKPPPAPTAPSARVANSPREACGSKERYALLQCMETQCAKKAWAKHEQCVRLRKDRKL